ncbi:alpha/beta hydrolase [Rhodocaloribacter litoris]|uniref:alpha/beta fold hydrolase n=1 Tax=Rhodocaloribacter litoris TaxID=2558931 RepID=UPI0014230F47|nr:alpha/beta hydrolase [Rhodocaloribacter litoris]QXD16899.1 alpha/beta hydrolase [Rhodocaloribacter litoris]
MQRMLPFSSMNACRMLPALLLAIAGPVSLAAQPADPPANGLFEVTVTGEGPPLIFLPGLASGGDVWDSTVAHYRNRYRCHVLTLAGFAGVSPVDRTPFLPAVRDALIEYIRRNHLEKPVLVGHSLGGFLALWVAATEPDLAGALIILDALPFLAATRQPDATPETVRPLAEQMRAMLAAQTPEQFRAYQAQVLPTMITAPDNVAEVLESVARSDPKTVAQAFYELYTTDLREDLARITAPVLVIGTWTGYRPYLTREQVQERFRAQYARLPNGRIVLSETARHFVMYDDPDGMLAEMDAFLSNLASP